MSGRPKISVVVPVYGCESCLRDLYARCVAALEPLVESFELVLVNDHSPHADWSVIEELAAKDPRVKGIDLARNFGQHYALACGLDHAEGDHVVVMDCDLQDRPEEIPRFYAKALEGWNVVFGKRVDRQDTAFKRTTSSLFYRVFAYITGKDIDRSVGNYSMISRRVVLNYRRFVERTRNYGFAIHWLGFPITLVPVKHAARHSGETTYSLRKMVGLAVDSLTAHSDKPLRASIGFGFAMTGGAFAYGLWLAFRRLAWGVGVEGWTSVMVSLYFLTGLLFANLGVIGLYLGRVFNEAQSRPLYVVRTTTFEDPERPVVRANSDARA